MRYSAVDGTGYYKKNNNSIKSEYQNDTIKFKKYKFTKNVPSSNKLIENDEDEREEIKEFFTK